MERSRLEALFLTYLEVGGFPGIQGDEAAERIATLQDYFEAIVTRDVVERHAYPNYQAVRYFAREALRCSGLEFSVNKTYNAMKSLGLGLALCAQGRSRRRLRHREPSDFYPVSRQALPACDQSVCLRPGLIAGGIPCAQQRRGPPLGNGGL
jgi:hypothetical protein